MIQTIKNWLTARRATNEKKYFESGYEWATFVLEKGHHTPAQLEAMADGDFNNSPSEKAFDRGIRAALDKHPTGANNG